jgi:hypothetical protein
MSHVNWTSIGGDFASFVEVRKEGRGGREDRIYLGIAQ